MWLHPLPPRRDIERQRVGGLPCVRDREPVRDLASLGLLPFLPLGSPLRKRILRWARDIERRRDRRAVRARFRRRAIRSHEAQGDDNHHPESRTQNRCREHARISGKAWRCARDRKQPLLAVPQTHRACHACSTNLYRALTSRAIRDYREISTVGCVRMSGHVAHFLIRTDSGAEVNEPREDSHTNDLRFHTGITMYLHSSIPVSATIPREQRS